MWGHRLSIDGWSGVPQGSHLGHRCSSRLLIRFVICLLIMNVFYVLKMHRFVKDTSDASAQLWLVWQYVRCLILFYYVINGQSLERCQGMRYLAILMDAAINFDSHIDQQIAKINRTLGFVKRNAKQFDDPSVTKSLSVLWFVLTNTALFVRIHSLEDSLDLTQFNLGFGLWAFRAL